MSWFDKTTQKLYDQSTSGWFGQKMNDIFGDDYHKHMFNLTVGGGLPTLGYGQDYRDAENEGESGWGRVGQNATKSAAALAAIFGGAALAGGGSSGAAAGGGGEMLYGTAADGSAITGQGAAGGGAGVGATDWGGLLGQFGGMAGGGGSGAQQPQQPQQPVQYAPQGGIQFKPVKSQYFGYFKPQQATGLLG